ncbi:class I SAM-dependent methyltransferase [Fimbriiglobus ruber]|uniref:Methyltransferase type 11 n=1 Tax=Fimbriiglobus ruber TaxID=1908690 RepID=A0A225D1Q5_9BACT|nr:methyltransferase type 11 [Fimbriiglobus ruber]OWK35540.1 hypothetical protein FRUB_08103 [Fimbriiglobus ruber]
MLVREAKWLAQRITELGDDALFPMLNVGSHTEAFRTREQPWIDRHIFGPARRRGAKVVHLDLQALLGVDLVGDLTDPAFLAGVSAMRFRSVFCSNLLEHVPNREEIGRATVAAVEPGGYLLASCPNRFPYHPDPIDTMYRPGVEELARLFPGTKLIRGEVIGCGTLATYLAAKIAHDPPALAKNVFRRKAQMIRATERGLSAVQWVPWLWRTFYQVAVVLRKKV